MNTIEQRSHGWFAQRLGKVTASKINDVLATLKSGGEAATRKNYRAQLVCERLTGTKQDNFSNAAMQWGTETEPLARAAYEFICDATVQEVGFIDHPTIGMTGASPDGLVGSLGMLEIKCPNTATHIEWMLAGCVPQEHQNQMLWQMECAERNWCDFASFDPRLPVELQLFVVRCHIDDSRVVVIRDAVQKFLTEVDNTVKALNGLHNHILNTERKAA